MTTPNPWNKRKSGPREFMPPSRALYAEKDGKKATATWVCRDGNWTCSAASGFLRWMRGMTDPEQARQIWVARHYKGFWIEPNTARVLAPPF